MNINPGRSPLLVNLYDGGMSPSGRRPSVLVDVRRLNLFRPRARYPLLECEGAVRAVELMGKGS